MENLQKVKAVQDDSGHWYVIPDELYDQFDKDLENEDMANSGDFDDLYGMYRTGGGINLVQLYAELKV